MNGNVDLISDGSDIFGVKASYYNELGYKADLMVTCNLNYTQT